MYKSTHDGAMNPYSTLDTHMKKHGISTKHPSKQQSPVGNSSVGSKTKTAGWSKSKSDGKPDFEEFKPRPISLFIVDRAKMTDSELENEDEYAAKQEEFGKEI